MNVKYNKNAEGKNDHTWEEKWRRENRALEFGREILSHGVMSLHFKQRCEGEVIFLFSWPFLGYESLSGGCGGLERKSKCVITGI